MPVALAQWKSLIVCERAVKLQCAPIAATLHTRANVPVLVVDASNHSECSDGWMNDSDCDSDITDES